MDPQHKTRRQFSKQFKAETVGLIRSSGKSVPQVCRDLVAAFFRISRSSRSTRTSLQRVSSRSAGHGLFGGEVGAIELLKSLSKEVGSRGVRVNAVSPGPVATSLWLGEDGDAATVGQTNGAHPDSVAGQAAAQALTGRFNGAARSRRFSSFCWPATAQAT